MWHSHLWGGLCHVGVAAQPTFGHHGIELIVAHIGDDRHLFQTSFGFLHRQSVGIKTNIQRQGGTGPTFLQGIGFHHTVGQHGDFVARHVNRR